MKRRNSYQNSCESFAVGMTAAGGLPLLSLPYIAVHSDPMFLMTYIAIGVTSTVLGAVAGQAGRSITTEGPHARGEVNFFFSFGAGLLSFGAMASALLNPGVQAGMQDKLDRMFKPSTGLKAPALQQNEGIFSRVEVKLPQIGTTSASAVKFTP